MEAKNLADRYGLPLVDWKRVEARLAGGPEALAGTVDPTTAAGWRPRTPTAART